MWQFVTLEANGHAVSSKLLQSHYSLQTSKPKKLGQIQHALTHRRYEFDVYTCDAKGSACQESNGAMRQWLTLKELSAYPLPRPHLKMMELLQSQQSL